MYDTSNLAAFTEDDVISVLDDAVLLGMERYHAYETPKAVLLAGQPGAGKTRLSSMVTLALGGDAVLINGDDPALPSQWSKCRGDGFIFLQHCCGAYD